MTTPTRPPRLSALHAQARRRGAPLLLAVLAAAVATAGFASSAAAATATLMSLGDGRSVSGLKNASPRSVSYAGTFNIRIDGTPPDVPAYCVDIDNPISIGNTVPQAPVDYPVEVLWILNNAFPVANNAGAPLGDVDCEAAAVQCAIWSYTDNMVCTSPASPATCDVAGRAAAIVAAANAAAPLVPTRVPQTLELTPPTASNFLNVGDTTHSVTADLSDDQGDPLSGLTISIVVQSGPGSPASTSGPSPSVTLNYTNSGATAGTDSIKASVTYTVPTGQKFKMAGKQGIVLAGSPQTGTLSGTAEKSWINDVCGNGMVGPGEECDDGNANDNDNCTNGCQNARCGDGIVDSASPNVEQCDDGNQNNNDDCKNDCTNNVCGDQVVNPATEECDDGNATNNDGCTNACRLPYCGDGILQTGEECDDGNTSNTDACTNACENAACGDGYVQAGEECDDGNQSNTDTCTNACESAECGDGYVQAGEECDDGNQSNTDACTNACESAECGDGYVQPGEQCDDGDQVDQNACKNDCTSNVCGDGVPGGPGEQCDDGNATNEDGCTNQCTLPACGDGIVQAGEECDDGNQSNTDSCTNQCTDARCGDSYVQAGEECDDGNQSNTDGCTNACENAECGDGYVQPGEECDDANQVDQDACRNGCVNNVCGDGVPGGPGEECDDGNQSNTDACTNACENAACGDGFVQAGEECDDGNQSNTDACTNACENAACGDGFVQAGEECDDANQVNDDGCNNQCRLGFCGDGVVQPGNGETCDDGNNLNGDGCSSTCALQEICTDQQDNDGDGKIDCDDTDCPCLVPQPVCKHPCPAVIVDNPTRPDMLRFQLAFDPQQSVDPATVKVAVTITNANGIVYAAALQPGDLDLKGNRQWIFRDPLAIKGLGSRGGLSLVKLISNNQGATGEWRVNVKAFGDLSLATEAEMTLQVVIGNDAFQKAATWTQTKRGWRVNFQ